MPEAPVFFSSSAEFREWLAEHHATEDVLWVGYYKVATNKPSMRWEESVREALCFGWIDGLRKSIDGESYKIRFTPRRTNSHWSNKNVRMVKELIEEGRMKDAGMKVYQAKDEANTGGASFEVEEPRLKQAYLDEIKTNAEAWTFFRELAPGYSKRSIHWVMSAKQEKTRRRRLQILIESCERGQNIPPLRYG